MYVLSFSVCNFVVHDRCLKTLVSPCSSIAASLIKVSKSKFFVLNFNIKTILFRTR